MKSEKVDLAALKTELDDDQAPHTIPFLHNHAFVNIINTEKRRSDQKLDTHLQVEDS
jgi:hypothetical protein